MILCSAVILLKGNFIIVHLGFLNETVNTLKISFLIYVSFLVAGQKNTDLVIH